MLLSSTSGSERCFPLELLMRRRQRSQVTSTRLCHEALECADEGREFVSAMSTYDVFSTVVFSRSGKLPSESEIVNPSAHQMYTDLMLRCLLFFVIERCT